MPTPQVVIDQQTWVLLQEQNTLLRQTVQTLETRDMDYRAVLETANQTIQQMETSAATQNSTQAAALNATEEQGATLNQTVQTLQTREGQFRTQLEGANQSIYGLEAELQNHQTAVQTLQNQNGDLARIVQLMQEREVQYQTQLQAANRALQAQANGSAGGGYAEHEEGEYEEHEEHEEGEYEEHEEDKEHEEDDD